MIAPTGRPGDRPVYQIGVVVADIEAGMDRYSRLFGLTGWKRMDTDYRARYRDWAGRIANRNAFAPWGPIHLELIEPGIGEGNAREWLRERGEGIFHIGVMTEDLDRDAQGADVVFEVKDSVRPDGGRAIIHLDTVASLGYFTELTWRPMAERLAAWVAAPED